MPLTQKSLLSRNCVVTTTSPHEVVGPLGGSGADLPALSDSATISLLPHHRLGTRLRQARVRAGLSQREAGEMLGVSYQQYQKYENGRDRISATNLYLLAGLFMTNLDWFHADGDASDVSRSRDSLLDDPLTSQMLTAFSSLSDRTDKELVLSFTARLATSNPACNVGSKIMGGHILADHDAAAASVVPRADEASPSKAVRVLLVDDDVDALRVSARMVQRAGFEVTAVASGDEALELLAANASPFDVLVTDHAMPGLSGLELVELALERRPELPALVVTGYSRDSELERLPTRVAVLSKPYTRTEFLRHIETLTQGIRERDDNQPGFAVYGIDAAGSTLVLARSEA